MVIFHCYVSSPEGILQVPRLQSYEAQELDLSNTEHSLPQEQQQFLVSYLVPVQVFDNP